MAKFKEETVTVRYPAEEISSLNIRSLNYAVWVTETSGSEIVIQYANNRFRKFDLQRNGSGIYMEEKMAVTFYGFFRWMELLKDNVLKIEVPKGYDQTSIVVETNATGIDVREASARNMSLTSTTGQIRVLNARFTDTLAINSESGKIICQLPGASADYNVDCYLEHSDVEQPVYPRNPEATKKVILRSRVYVPQIAFS